MKRLLFILAAVIFITATSFNASCVKSEPVAVSAPSFMRTHPAAQGTITVSYISYNVSGGQVWIMVHLTAPSDAYHQVVLKTDFIMANGTPSTFYPDIEINQGETEAQSGFAGNEGAGHSFSSTVYLILF